jgi:hypothetical protein
MQAAMEADNGIGIDGPIRPGNGRRMAGETEREDAVSGYTDQGHIFAIGYIK